MNENRIDALLTVRFASLTGVKDVESVTRTDDKSPTGGSGDEASRFQLKAPRETGRENSRRGTN